MRTDGDPAAAIPSVRGIVGDLDPDLPIWSLRPYEEIVGATLDGRRFATGVLTLFASLALVLAIVGVFGVVQQWVASRRSEIAIRIVLGAGKDSILRWAGAHATRLIGTGLAIGIVGAPGASRWLRGVVFGVSASDPVTLAAAALGVVAVAAAAAGLPLARAAAVDAVSEIDRG